MTIMTQSYYFECEAAALRSAMRACATSISTEETRYYLNGIFVQLLNKGGLKLVATNGHHLTVMPVEVRSRSSAGAGVIWSRDGIKAAIKALHKRGGFVHVQIGDHASTITQGDWSATVRHVDGTYVDYERVIPQQSVNRCQVKARDLQAELQKLDIKPGKWMTPDGRHYESEPGAATLHLNGRELTIGRRESTTQIEITRKARTITKGKRAGQIEVKEERKPIKSDSFHHAGRPMAVRNDRCKGAFAGFNWSYLVELTAGQRGAIWIDFAEAARGGPCRIECEDGALRVLMPMRV